MFAARRGKLSRRQAPRFIRPGIDMLLEDRLLLADIRYIGGMGSNWSTDANWDGGSKPGVNDTPVFTATSPAVTLDIDATVAGLRMEAVYNAAVTLNAAKTLTVTAGATQAGGTVDGAGTLKVTGTLSWTGGTQKGTGTTRLEGTSTLDTNAKTLDGRRLENAGTVNWQGGNLNVSNGATIVNLAGATFDLQRDVSILNAGGSASTFDNDGFFKKTGGTGVSQVQIDFNNNANVDVDWATVNFGRFTNDGNIDGEGEIGIFGDFTWKSGFIRDTSTAATGIIRLAAGTTAYFTTSAIKILFSRPMESFATVYWDGGVFALNGSNRSVFTNKPGATFKIRGGETMSGTGGGTFRNAVNGTVIKETGQAYEVTIRPISFYNDGTFDVQYGNVVIQATGEHTGQFQISAQGDKVVFDGNFTNTFKTGPGASDPHLGVAADSVGVYQVNNDMSLIVDQPATLYADFLVLGAAGKGTITGTGILQATRLDWRTGDMTNTGATLIPAGGQLNILAATSRTMDKRSLIIQGVATWTNDDITVSNGATIHLDGAVAGGGIFDVQCDKTIRNPGPPNAAGKFTIDNGGLLKKSAGVGQTDIQMDVETKNGGKVEMNKNLKVKSETNISGIIEVNGGTLTVVEGFEQQGGNTSVAGGTLAVLGAFAESGGTISVTGSGAAVSVGGAATVEGGTLAVNLGTFTASASFTQTGGTISVMGSGSLLSVTGTFQQSGGTVTTLGGTGGRLSVTGSVVLSGSAVLTIQNGLLDATGGVTIGSGATLNGYGGGITGDVSNYGTLSLTDGSSVYSLSITGNYTQGQTGTLKVGLASSSSYSVLSVSGAANLGGTLHVDLLGGFSPPPGMGFSVLTYGSRSGTFGTLELPPLGFGHWNPQYDNPTGTFTLWVTYF